MFGKRITPLSGLFQNGGKHRLSAQPMFSPSTQNAFLRQEKSTNNMKICFQFHGLHKNHHLGRGIAAAQGPAARGGPRGRGGRGAAAKGNQALMGFAMQINKNVYGVALAGRLEVPEPLMPGAAHSTKVRGPLSMSILFLF